MSKLMSNLSDRFNVRKMAGRDDLPLRGLTLSRIAARVRVLLRGHAHRRRRDFARFLGTEVFHRFDLEAGSELGEMIAVVGDLTSKFANLLCSGGLSVLCCRFEFGHALLSIYELIHLLGRLDDFFLGLCHFRRLTSFHGFLHSVSHYRLTLFYSIAYSVFSVKHFIDPSSRAKLTTG